MTALRLESPHEVCYRTKRREVLRREFVVTDADIEEILTLNPKFSETQRTQAVHRTQTVVDLQVFRCRLYEQFGEQILSKTIFDLDLNEHLSPADRDRNTMNSPPGLAVKPTEVDRKVRRRLLSR